MWPWTAAAFAYLCYSSYTHVRRREPPGSSAVVVAAVASILPDVVDKPLTWQFGVFRTGYALGHSAFLGLLLLGSAHLLARGSEHPRWGLAFGIGYLSHSVGDVLEALPYEPARTAFARVLWPVVRLPPEHVHGFEGKFGELLAGYLSHLLALDPTPYLVLVSVIGVCALSLWAYDGFPVLRELVLRWRTTPE